MDDRDQQSGRPQSGSVPGGSYGGGGGWQQGGFEQGNFDPSLQFHPRAQPWQRAERSRGRGDEGRYRPPGPWQAERGGEGGYGRAPERDREGGYGRTPERGRGADRFGEQRTEGPAQGDWRRGYGGYGMSERSGGGPGGMHAGEDMFGGEPYDDEPSGGYGVSGGRSDRAERWRAADDYGTEGGWGGGSAFGEHGPEQPWGVGGRPNRGSQGRGSWRGEAQWQGGRDFGAPQGGARGELDWPYTEPWAVPGPYTGRGPENYERSMEAIRNDVCERLTRHGQLDASRIRVLVENGEVILEGQVDSRSAKRMAEDTAETVAGVRDVQNRLRIRDRERDGNG